MQLTRFSGRGVHGYLHFDVKFFSDVTFLHGINGCGKTTVLKAIVALLTPDVQWLCSTLYRSICVEFVVANQQYEIYAERQAEMTHLCFKEGAEVVAENSFSLEEFKNPDIEDTEWISSSGDRIQVQEERLINKLRSYETFEKISQLPTPMFLGLERTTLSFFGERPDRSRLRRRVSRPYLRPSMNESLNEADQLLQSRLRKALAEKDGNSATLREAIIFSLFEVPDEKDGIATNFPDKSTIRELKSTELRIIKTFREMKFKTEGVEDRIRKFFADIFARAEPLTQFRDFSSALKKLGENVTPTFSQWFEASRSLESVQKILHHIEKFDEKEKVIFRPLENYAKSINKFFNDSGKMMEITDDWRFQVKLPSGNFGDFSLLSSGERQIFVLLTHLALNEQARKANVLIVDEPELSLHMEWQKGFVQAALEADPDLQMILATHSPAIVMGREDNCVLIRQ